MFESTVLRRSPEGYATTFGEIAEALLYYQKVHIIIDRGTLVALVKQIGTNRLLTLISNPRLSSVYTEEILATKTDAIGPFETHLYTALTISGHQDVGQYKDITERVYRTLEQEGIERSVAKRFAKRFTDRVPARKLSGNHFLPGGIPEAGKKDLFDQAFRLAAVRTIVASMSGGYRLGEDLKFDVVDSDLGMYVFHNLDLNAIDLYRRSNAPATDAITVAQILNNALEARADLTFALHYGGDFVTSRAGSNLMRVRHSEILRRSNLNNESKQQFHEVTLPDAPTVSEVIDSGERSFEDFFRLLDRSARFKTWLSTVNPDDDLVRSYVREITAEGWVQSLPVKILRYLFVTAVESSNPLLGLAAGLNDTFVLDKMLGGWRPNHFIKARLGPFVSTNNQ